jgi:hypothetical protein
MTVKLTVERMLKQEFTTKKIAGKWGGFDEDFLEVQVCTPGAPTGCLFYLLFA